MTSMVSFLGREVMTRVSPFKRPLLNDVLQKRIENITQLHTESFVIHYLSDLFPSLSEQCIKSGPDH